MAADGSPYISNQWVYRRLKAEDSGMAGGNQQSHLWEWKDEDQEQDLGSALSNELEDEVRHEHEENSRLPEQFFEAVEDFGRGQLPRRTKTPQQDRS